MQMILPILGIVYVSSVILRTNQGKKIITTIKKIDSDFVKDCQELFNDINDISKRNNTK